MGQTDDHAGESHVHDIFKNLLEGLAGGREVSLNFGARQGGKASAMRMIQRHLRRHPRFKHDEFGNIFLELAPGKYATLFLFQVKNPKLPTGDEMPDGATLSTDLRHNSEMVVEALNTLLYLKGGELELCELLALRQERIPELERELALYTDGSKETRFMAFLGREFNDNESRRDFLAEMLAIHQPVKHGETPDHDSEELTVEDRQAHGEKDVPMGQLPDEDPAANMTDEQIMEEQRNGGPFNDGDGKQVEQHDQAVS